MKPLLQGAMRYLPLILGLAILVAIAPFVPWREVWPYLGRLTPAAALTLVALSALYYFGRALRYWILLRALGQPVPMNRVIVAVLVAQPVAVLPAGELYRASMLRRYADVPVKETAPGVFAQTMAEAIGLLVIALTGAALLHRYVAVLVALGVAFLVIVLVVRFQNDAHSHRLVNKLPFISVSLRAVRGFMTRNRILMTGRTFVALVLAGYVSTAAGIGIVYLAARIVGSELDGFQAAIAYCLPVVLEAVSFLPAGLGLNEASSASLLTLFGASLPQAAAITIIVRLATLGLGFPFGFAAMGWARLRRYRRFD